MSETLVIVGASARAAAASAVRANFRPACADLFADADLRRLGPALVTPDFPNGLLELARKLSPAPWIYTGGLENYPDVVEAISRDRVLYGNPPPTLRAVRDPARIAAALHRHDLKFPECQLAADDLPIDGSWLRKRFHSSAGHGVQIWRGGQNRRSEDAYFQRRIAGASCAAVFVAANRQSRLIGVTKQLVGSISGEGSVSRDISRRDDGFQYRGSIGPLQLTPTAAGKWSTIGSALAREFDLQGLFGVDAIIDGAGQIWPVEVNPRYTASVEILERGLGLPALGCHVEACRDGRLRDDVLVARGCHGKAIVYARTDLKVDAELAALFERANEGSEWPQVADLPNTGTIIRQGQPVVTVFAATNHDGTDASLEVEQALQATEQELLAVVRANQSSRR
jgi:predicted ATP-grasp superfamily ATP-dependent carboligase